MRDLGIEDDVLLWNVVPTHPGTGASNRTPTREEVEAGRRFAERLSTNRSVVAVGRVAAEALGAPYVCHPSRGGAADFESGMRHWSYDDRR
ncbi:MAG: uracil-DNA glycosylase family protein [Gaiellaceae bacterium]